jgi:hypothetical protein
MKPFPLLALTVLLAPPGPPLATPSAPAPAVAAPGLFFREDWKETPPQTPITQDHVGHPDLILTCHGPGQALVRKSHHDQPADDPYYVWSGETTSNWAVSLRHRRMSVDLTGPGRIRWRSRQTGFRALRIVLKLGDGSWVVSDTTDGESAEWRVREFAIADVRWRVLDVDTVVEGRAVPDADLSRVVEVGFTDLMRGGRTPASSRLDWIEVYGRAVPTNGSE